MSTETHVFFRGKLPDKAELQRVMLEMGFPFTIADTGESLEDQDGYMPMMRGETETGVEFDVFNGHDAVKEFGYPGVDQSFERVANFRWGGDYQEAVAGMCGAAALAQLVNGVVFDEAEDRLQTIAAAVEVAQSNLAALDSGEY